MTKGFKTKSIFFLIFLTNTFVIGQTTNLINNPWTTLFQVSETTANNYYDAFLQNKKELIFDSALYNKYGGQGGVSVLAKGAGLLEVLININVIQPTELRTGEIFALDSIGSFDNMELGRISDKDYNYVFYILDNKLVVNGGGPVDNIKVNFTDSIILISDQNYPWTSLVEVIPQVKSDYNNIFSIYKGQLIFDDTELFEKYNGEGGFNISKNTLGLLTISIKINLKNPSPFNIGDITSLSEMGMFPDCQLGSISGDNFEYFFSIINNNLHVTGHGNIKNVSVDLNQIRADDNSSLLVYDRNYPWTKLFVTENNIADQYEEIFRSFNDQLLYEEDLYEQFGMQGGMTLSTNSFNQLVLYLNIQSEQPISMKTGELLSLSALGQFEDVDLGSIVGKEYVYKFYILDNKLMLDGVGLISDLQFLINDKSKLLHGVNYPWTNLLLTDSILEGDYISFFELNKQQLIYSHDAYDKFGTEGGIAIINNGEEINIDILINSKDPITIRNGNIIDLNSFGNIADVQLGKISGENYEYLFSIVDNKLAVVGSGSISTAVLDITFHAIIQ